LYLSVMEWTNVYHLGASGKLRVDDKCLLWTSDVVSNKQVNISLFKLSHARLLFKREKYIVRLLFSLHTFDFVFPTEETFNEYLSKHQTIQRNRDKLPEKETNKEQTQPILQTRFQKKLWTPVCPFQAGTRVTIHVQF